MKKALIIFALIGFNLVFAIPTVAEIKNAIQQNNPQLVETLSKQVIAAKPNSAKAHYFLGEAYLHENRKQLALQELNTARSLDSSLSFASSPQTFNNVMTQAMNSGHTMQTVTTTTTRHMSHYNNSHSNIMFWCIIFSIILGIAFMFWVAIMLIELFNPRSDNYYYGNGSRSGGSSGGNSYYVNGSRSGGSSGGNSNCNGSRSGGSSGGNSNCNGSGSTSPHVVNNYGGGNGFVNGMVAGVVLDEMLSGHHRGGGYRDDNYSDRDNTSTTTTTTSTNWDSDSSSSSWDSGNSSSDWGGDSSSSSDW